MCGGDESDLTTLSSRSISVRLTELQTFLWFLRSPVYGSHRSLVIRNKYTTPSMVAMALCLILSFESFAMHFYFWSDKFVKTFLPSSSINCVLELLTALDLCSFLWLTCTIDGTRIYFTVVAPAGSQRAAALLQCDVTGQHTLTQVLIVQIIVALLPLHWRCWKINGGRGGKWAQNGNSWSLLTFSNYTTAAIKSFQGPWNFICHPNVFSHRAELSTAARVAGSCWWNKHFSFGRLLPTFLHVNLLLHDSLHPTTAFQSSWQKSTIFSFLDETTCSPTTIT